VNCGARFGGDAPVRSMASGAKRCATKRLVLGARFILHCGIKSLVPSSVAGELIDRRLVWDIRRFISLFEGKARRRGVRGSYHAMVASAGSGG
jgi:hypothetical protein